MGAPDPGKERGPDLLRALQELDAASGATADHLNACVRCGLCGETCHIWLADPVPENLPAAKAEQVASLYRRRHTFLGRWLPRMVGARDLTPEAVAGLRDALFGRCTGCGRCSLHCAIGLDISAVLRAGRKVLAAAGATPGGIARTLRNQIETGNQMTIPGSELTETAAWIAEELAREIGDPSAQVPVDVAGSRVLYVVNPREIEFFPLSLQAAAGIFHAARESWTLSSRAFDVTNYAYFAGDDEAAAELCRRIFEEARRLDAREIVLSECGHGYRALRWEAPEWLGAPAPVPVRSIVEILDEYLAAGRLRVDPSRNPGRLTLHDPCNLVRWGGVVEPQRRILRRVAADFVEMTPNRQDNFCCGGGGGMLANEEYGARRVSSGARKAGQIRSTGAAVVATPCHNCADQLIELCRVEKIDAEVRSLVEVVYDALLWDRPGDHGGAPAAG